MTENRFGGNWTRRKLVCLQSYIQSYSNVMKNKDYFTKIYIDPFCGSGSWLEDSNSVEDMLEPEDKELNHGSPITALQVGKNFNEFYFNDKNQEFIDLLKSQIGSIPDRKIHYNSREANEFLMDISSRINWQNSRAIVFLDPFGLQINWSTLVRMSETRAIDIVMLFPTSSLCRMLPNSELPMPEWQSKLDRFLGTTEWRKFYHKKQVVDLFGASEKTERTANSDDIINFVIKQLGSIFFVVDKKLNLKNSKGSSLFDVIFLCANRNPKVHALVDKIAIGAVRFAQKELN